MKNKPLKERIGTTEEKITKVDAKTGKVSASLTNAQKRWKHYHDLARQDVCAVPKGAREGRQAPPEGSAREGGRARPGGDGTRSAIHERAYQSAGWISKVKPLKQRQEGLEDTEEMLRARLEKLREQKGPKIKGNKVVGGTPEKRLQVCMLTSAARCAKGLGRTSIAKSGPSTFSTASPVRRAIIGTTAPRGFRRATGPVAFRIPTARTTRADSPAPSPPTGSRSAAKRPGTRRWRRSYSAPLRSTMSRPRSATAPSTRSDTVRGRWIWGLSTSCQARSSSGSTRTPDPGHTDSVGSRCRWTTLLRLGASPSSISAVEILAD